MIDLPPLRKKILHGYLSFIAVFGVMCIFLTLSSVFMTTSITPKMVHANYDSIESARKMQQAWNALHSPSVYQDLPEKKWTDQFNDALSIALSKTNGPGEVIMSHKIEALWNQWKQGVRSDDLTRGMNDQLEDLTVLNEKDMFQLIIRGGNARRAFIIGVAFFFVVTFVITLLMVDSLSSRLAKPLKDIAEVLRSKIKPGERLKLPEPTSLEIRILNEELSSLWERVGRSDQLNLEKILRQKNQLETLLSSVEDAVITWDNKGRVTHVNQRMAELIGLGTDSIVDMMWLDLPSMSDNYFKLREISRERGKESSSFFELGTEKENHRRFEARVREVYSPAGELVSTIFLLHDVTEVHTPAPSKGQ